MFQETTATGAVRCHLCPHGCTLPSGGRGRCGVRANDGGRLISLVADRVISLQVDPVEKKPLYHFLPGSLTLSYATVGCNLTCTFCQNASISQHRDPPFPGQKVLPAALIGAAQESRSPSISATYTEPTVYYELASEMGQAARAAGLRNIWVSNGFISALARRDLVTWLDGINIDLKAMRDETYREYCGARLGPVLETISDLVASGIWVEVTTLVIPGLNDSPAELRELARFLVSLSPDLPWHLSAFHPDYRMQDKDCTPLATLTTARDIGHEEGLRHVYLGNIRHPGGRDTKCPNCGQLLINRGGFQVTNSLVTKTGTCPWCPTKIAGRFI